MSRLLCLLLLAFASTTSANDDLSFPFTSENLKNWRFASDQVMGGLSEGAVSVKEDEGKVFTRLVGKVSTDNNGGFLKLRTTTSRKNKPLMFKAIHNSKKNGQQLKGVRLSVRGNEETYHIFIQTSIFYKLPYGFYIAPFKTTPDWQTVDIPFTEFSVEGKKYSAFDPEDIKTFAIVAYGRDFSADVSVSQIDFYY